MDSTITKEIYRPLKDGKLVKDVRRNRIGDYSRIALAVVRLFYGTLALFFPQFLARRLGVNPDRYPAILYVFRLFGIRTIVIGAELLSSVATTREESLRTAVVIHASDTLAASWAGIHKQLPLRSAIITTAISAGNTILAFLAQFSRTR